MDDEPFLREAAAASLRFLGFEVTAAENGTDALRLARSRPFDLLVLDVVLPHMDGFEIVRRLRRDGSTLACSWSGYARHLYAVLTTRKLIRPCPDLLT
jgi:CheY-like chemotaxis protein